jgi:hypothetical protein
MQTTNNCSFSCASVTLLFPFNSDTNQLYAISGFRRDVDCKRALLGHYAAWDGNSVSRFREGRKSKKNIGNVVICLLPLL